MSAFEGKADITRRWSDVPKADIRPRHGWAPASRENFDRVFENYKNVTSLAREFAVS
jgi:hypothetical protein